MELTTAFQVIYSKAGLFMMSKIQNLNGTHNGRVSADIGTKVVYDVKDTKFEWNSQQSLLHHYE